VQRHASLSNQQVGRDYDFFVEGDDMIIAYNDKSVWKTLKNTYNACGFQTTTEHSGTLDGSSFCKIIFQSDKRGNYQGYRRIDHTIMKLGWTKKCVRKKDS
jgi:hypothetical protein